MSKKDLFMDIFKNYHVQFYRDGGNPTKSRIVKPQFHEHLLRKNIFAPLKVKNFSFDLKFY